MNYSSKAFLNQLQADVREILVQATELQQVSTGVLHSKPANEGWSAAQVLEHLNIYARHYVPAIESALHLHQTEPSALFRAGWLGAYFTKLMKPGATLRVSKKMKAPKNAQPSSNPDAAAMLTEFVGHQHQLLNLLSIAHSAHLSMLRVPTSLHPWIRLKLGDTFAFFIAHEQRHLLQISRIPAVTHSLYSQPSVRLAL